MIKTYGLSTTQCRIFAYELAIENKKKIPKTWENRKIVGYNYFHGIIYRNKSLSISRLVSTSIAKANFFDSLLHLFNEGKQTCLSVI